MTQQLQQVFCQNKSCYHHDSKVVAGLLRKSCCNDSTVVAGLLQNSCCYFIISPKRCSNSCLFPCLTRWYALGVFNPLCPPPCWTTSASLRNHSLCQLDHVCLFKKPFSSSVLCKQLWTYNTAKVFHFQRHGYESVVLDVPGQMSAVFNFLIHAVL